MYTFLRTFRVEDDGAVTVDWVVLTAALVGLAVAVIALVVGGATDQSTGIGVALSSVPVHTN